MAVFTTLPEEYIAGLSFTQLMSLADSSLYPPSEAITSTLVPPPAIPNPSQYPPFVIPDPTPVILSQPRVVYDPVLACELYEVSVMEQLPPLPASIDPTYQFGTTMSDFPHFVDESYHFEAPLFGPVEEEPAFTPDQVFALF